MPMLELIVRHAEGVKPKRAHMAHEWEPRSLCGLELDGLEVDVKGRDVIVESADLHSWPQPLPVCGRCRKIVS